MVRAAAIAGLVATSCAPAPTPGPDLGWLSRVAADPDALRPVLDADRDGWIAWHAGRPWDATLPAGPAARAAWDHALLLDDLSALHHAALERLVARWDARGTLPADTAAWAVLAASRACHGAPAGDAPARAAPTPFPADHPALAPRPAAPPVGAPPAPPLMLIDTSAFPHAWRDPCAEAALARALRASAPAQSTDELVDLLFAPWLSAADWDAAVLIAGPEAALAALPSVDALGLTQSDPATTTADAARASVTALSRELDAASAALLSRPGGAVLADLSLLPRQRQRWLADRGRALLQANNPAAALATLEPAIDVGHRGVGPTNAPSVFVLLAHARLGNGRVREALDALQPVADAYPAAAAVREVLADLSALEGLDRLGDSKEL
jgi:hypothetical protein